MRTRTKRRPAAAVRRAVTRPDDTCLACGTTMRERRGNLSLPVNGEEVTVTDVAHLRCPKCGEVVLTLAQSRQFRQRALEIYRHKYGLLSAAEIRAIRERYGLTQAEFARLLRLGGNTVSRWEAGRNVQTAAMDVLVRLIRDLPGSLEYLREHAA